MLRIQNSLTTAAIFLAVLVTQTPAAYAQEVVVLGPDLEPKTTRLDAVSLSDEGLLRLRLREEPTAPLNDKQYVARLTDGQVLVGTLFGAGQDGESIRLAFGYQQRAVECPLDDLLSLTRVGTTLDSDANDDTLLLATGETLVGFVDSVGEKSIGFVVGDAEDPVQIPMDRVRGFSIANKPKPVKAEKGLARVQLRCGSWLWLRDAALQPATERQRAALSGTLTLNNVSTAIALPLIEVQLVEPWSARYTLQALSDFSMTLLSGGEVFGLKLPPRIDREGNIHLHAPTTLGFELPKGASRLALTAALNLGEDIPEARRKLAGCELVVYSGSEVVGGGTLSPEQPSVRLNLTLTGQALRLELKPGVNGPVLDRVLLTHAELLIDKR